MRDRPGHRRRPRRGSPARRCRTTSASAATTAPSSSAPGPDPTAVGRFVADIGVTPPSHDGGMALTFRSHRTPAPARPAPATPAPPCGPPARPRRTTSSSTSITPEVAHTRIDCPDNGGLIELVETYLGTACDDPMVFEYVADMHGLVAPAHLVHQARPCPHCTLVAAPYWLSAA